MMINKIRNSFVMLVFVISGCTLNVSNEPLATDTIERVTQELFFLPFLPIHQQISTSNSTIVKIRLVDGEKHIQISGDVTIQQMNFNHSAPEPVMLVHQDDYAELKPVKLKENILSHEFDFYAATTAADGRLWDHFNTELWLRRANRFH